MKQSRLTSWLESITSTAVGFGISLAAQWFFLPLLGVEIALHQNLMFAAIMTVISIGRGYVMRRVFEHFGIRTKLSPFVQAVLAERRRQIEVEGWSIEHDDEHAAGELSRAGAAYAAYAHAHLDVRSGFKNFGYASTIWPWAREWWKPTEFRRDLVKGCALIVAEGERHDRNRKRKVGA
jgi:hypothetical protein